MLRPGYPLQIDLWNSGGGVVALVGLASAIAIFAAIGRRRRAKPFRWLATGYAWLVSAGLAGMAVFYLATLQRSGVDIDEDALVVRGIVDTRVAAEGIYGRRARLIDVSDRPNFEIAAKDRAFAQPGFTSGWVRLNNGMRVYALVGEGSKRVLVPTADRYYLMLGVQNAQKLVSDLKSWAAVQKNDEP